VEESGEVNCFSIPASIPIKNQKETWIAPGFLFQGCS
jgi:hypothetical protein